MYYLKLIINTLNSLGTGDLLKKVSRYHYFIIDEKESPLKGDASFEKAKCTFNIALSSGSFNLRHSFQMDKTYSSSYPSPQLHSSQNLAVRTNPRAVKAEGVQPGPERGSGICISDTSLSFPTCADASGLRTTPGEALSQHPQSWAGQAASWWGKSSLRVYQKGKVTQRPKHTDI